jgi:hypothetical protein
MSQQQQGAVVARVDSDPFMIQNEPLVTPRQNAVPLSSAGAQALTVQSQAGGKSTPSARAQRTHTHTARSVAHIPSVLALTAYSQRPVRRSAMASPAHGGHAVAEVMPFGGPSLRARESFKTWTPRTVKLLDAPAADADEWDELGGALRGAGGFREDGGRSTESKSGLLVDAREESFLSIASSDGHDAAVMLLKPRSALRTLPGAAELSKMSREELTRVSGFTVIHDEFGSVRWEGETDITDLGAPLDDLVSFGSASLEVYPDRLQADVPAPGTKLNRAGLVTLKGVWPKKKGQSAADADASGAVVRAKPSDAGKLSRWEGKLSKRKNTQFVSFNVETGDWKFRMATMV